MKIIKTAPIFLSFSLCISAAVSGSQPKTSSAINVVFITIDALRADHLGCYGYKRQTSPAIDRLASQGVLFTQAIIQACYTSASIASIFTSQYPCQRKVLSPINSYLKRQFCTLAEILKKNNYATAAVTPNFILESRFGFRQGFDFCSMAAPENRQTDVAIDWIKQHKNEPFLIWVHYLGLPRRSGTEGASLLPLILGKGGYPDDYAFSDVLSKQSIRTNDWKLIYNQDKNSYELYFLKKRPRGIKRYSFCRRRGICLPEEDIV